MTEPGGGHDTLLLRRSSDFLSIYYQDHHWNVSGSGDVARVCDNPVGWGAARIPGEEHRKGRSWQELVDTCQATPADCFGDPALVACKDGGSAPVAPPSGLDDVPTGLLPAPVAPPEPSKPARTNKTDQGEAMP